MSQAGDVQSRRRLLALAVVALVLAVVGALRLWGPYAPYRAGSRSAQAGATAPAPAAPTPVAGLPAGAAPITAQIETAALPHSGDAADDAAVWIPPTDPSRSTVIATDEEGGLAVYDLAGRQLFYHGGTRPNSVDVRYNFPLAGQHVSLVATSDRGDDTIRVYTVDPATRDVRDVTARRIATNVGVYGLCMYHSARTGRYAVFVTDQKGTLQQWELFDEGGRVDARKVRTLAIGSKAKGCVADDDLGDLYVAEEEVGLWKYGAEPTAGAARTQIDTTEAGRGHLAKNVEGVALYHTTGSDGYLIASSQGSNDYAVYERGGQNRYLTRFSIASGAIDEVTRTKGIDVTSFDLGGAFTEGLFVAQDDHNDSGNQNIKLVPWGVIARSSFSPLLIDTRWDPRAPE
jgi:3-phytase